MRAGAADPPRLPVPIGTPDDPASATTPRSPCIRHCCLDEADVCLGCGRHVDEITGWHVADDAARAAILARAQERRRLRATRLARGSG